MIAVSMGDPSGIGPEVVLKGFFGQPRRVHVGDPELFALTADRLGLAVTIRTVASPEQAETLPERLFAVLPTTARVAIDAFQFGQPHPGHAAAVIESIRTACQLAQAGRVSAMVTPPIHKGVLHDAGFDFPGHTEMLAACVGVPHPVMMLTGGGLRVIPATIHQSLATVPEALTFDRLHGVIDTVITALQRDFALPRPRVAVTGLNPHAGEGGRFGDEEATVIEPVCRALREKHGGHVVRGPLSADSLFHAEARNGYDAVVCMYHDQALIPIKMLAFGNAVNVTLGLPIIRTSVDHGTAFDIAGRGIANHHSYLAALALAGEMAVNRARSLKIAAETVNRP